jgi:hypothetical protein
MNKKIWIVIWSAIIWASTIAAPMITSANWFTNQNATTIWVVWWDKGGTWDTSFISFVQTAVNWILWFLGLISIIVLIWGGFQMVTAAGDDGKYKKWFTIVKQAVIWLILIWASAMIINLVFNFMSSNTTAGSWTSS